MNRPGLPQDKTSQQNDDDDDCDDDDEEEDDVKEEGEEVIFNFLSFPSFSSFFFLPLSLFRDSVVTFLAKSYQSFPSEHSNELESNPGHQTQAAPLVPIREGSFTSLGN